MATLAMGRTRIGIHDIQVVGGSSALRARSRYREGLCCVRMAGTKTTFAWRIPGYFDFNKDPLHPQAFSSGHELGRPHVRPDDSVGVSVPDIAESYNVSVLVDPERPRSAGEGRQFLQDASGKVKTPV